MMALNTVKQEARQGRSMFFLVEVMGLNETFCPQVQSKQPVVKPDWVWACNDAGALLPTASYQFV
jgi:hypothetical protein